MLENEDVTFVMNSKGKAAIVGESAKEKRQRSSYFFNPCVLLVPGNLPACWRTEHTERVQRTRKYKAARGFFFYRCLISSREDQATEATTSGTARASPPWFRTARPPSSRLSWWAGGWISERIDGLADESARVAVQRKSIGRRQLMKPAKSNRLRGCKMRQRGIDDVLKNKEQSQFNGMIVEGT